MLGIKVRDFFEAKQKEFEFELLTEDGVGLDKHITVSEVNRPGIALAGYLEYFPYHRLQVLGNAEMFYLRTLSHDARRAALAKMFTYDLPCMVIMRNLEPPRELIEECSRARTALIRTTLSTTKFISEVNAYLEDVFAPMIGLHGVLIDVYGLGVLIVGESGIGKSECALELLKRGHRLVADDLVHLKQKAGGVVLGRAGDVVKHYMEIRGVGIIDIKTMFGVAAILDTTHLGLVVELLHWEKMQQEDRLLMEQKYEVILNVPIPKTIISIKPGRNLAVLVEIAAMSQRLKNQGYNPAKELDEKLMEHLRRKANTIDETSST